MHEQSIDALRRSHRITARLGGPFGGVPGELAGRVQATAGDATAASCWSPASSLAPLLGWLATLPLNEVRIEPVGLGGVYDRFHRPVA